MENFWDYNVWGTLNIFAFLLLSLLAANSLKRIFPALKASLIPTSVLGGAILLLIGGIYKLVTGDVMFDTQFFGGNGMATLEVITYHTLALGFIASALKSSENAFTKKRTIEIFNSGLATCLLYNRVLAQFHKGLMTGVAEGTLQVATRQAKKERGRSGEVPFALKRDKEFVYLHSSSYVAMLPSLSWTSTR